MSPTDQGRNMAHLDQSMDLGGRVRWFIRGNYQGGGTIKRLCREFNWNEAKAKRVFNGEGIRNEDVDLMARRWGWRFVQFIYSPVCGPGGLAHDIAEFKASLERIEACVAGGASAVRDAWVLSRSDAPTDGRNMPRPVAGVSVERGSSERDGAEHPELKAAAE